MDLGEKKNQIKKALGISKFDFSDDDLNNMVSIIKDIKIEERTELKLKSVLSSSTHLMGIYNGKKDLKKIFKNVNFDLTKINKIIDSPPEIHTKQTIRGNKNIVGNKEGIHFNIGDGSDNSIDTGDIDSILDKMRKP